MLAIGYVYYMHVFHQVSVADTEEAGHRYNFPCGQWLSEDEEKGDGKTYKILYPIGKGKHRHGQREPGTCIATMPITIYAQVFTVLYMYRTVNVLIQSYTVV